MPVAKGKPEYENIFAEWGKAYDNWKPYAKHRMYINEGIAGSGLIIFCGLYAAVGSRAGKTIRQAGGRCQKSGRGSGQTKSCFP